MGPPGPSKSQPRWRSVTVAWRLTLWASWSRSFSRMPPARIGVRIEQVQLFVFQQEVAQVQIAVAELGEREFVNDREDIVDDFAMVRRIFAADGEIVEVLIERNRRLDGFKDDSIADGAIVPKSVEMRYGARGGNLRFLQPLQSEEFPQCWISAHHALPGAILRVGST